MRLLLEEYGTTLVACIVLFAILALFGTGFMRQLGSSAEEEMESAFSHGKEHWSDYWEEEHVKLKLSKEVLPVGASIRLSELLMVTMNGEQPLQIECTYLKFEDEFLSVIETKDPVLRFAEEGVYTIGIRVKSQKHREYESFFLLPVGEGGRM